MLAEWLVAVYCVDIMAVISPIWLLCICYIICLNAVNHTRYGDNSAKRYTDRYCYRYKNALPLNGINKLCIDRVETVAATWPAWYTF
jgi:hypothetical protein